ncbi:MAG: hypothetical protein J6C97_03920 [Clostridia bacterium]|nr:hypothetical protein [Clostridia bacterium]
MDKKSIIQILIGILAAIIVFCAIYIPISNCKGGCKGSDSNSSRYSDVGDSYYADDPFSGDYDNP